MKDYSAGDFAAVPSVVQAMPRPQRQSRHAATSPVRATFVSAGHLDGRRLLPSRSSPRTPATAPASPSVAAAPHSGHAPCLSAAARPHPVVRLVRDILMSEQGSDLHRQDIRPGELLERLIGSFGRELARRHIAYESSVQGDCRISGNAAALTAALANLLHNALQYISDNGRIRIIVRPVLGEYVDICVGDNGPGIGTDAQQHILQTFYTTREGAAGLGLCVTEAVARAHDGFIWYQSKPGRGSLFALRLPVLQERQEQ